MSLGTDMSAADLAAVVGNDRNNSGFFGGDGLYAIIVLFILMAMIGNGGWGGVGGGMGGGAFPWLLAGQTNQGNDVQRGFDQSALMTGITGISNSVNTGFAGVNQALCGGFAGVNATINNGFANAETAATARQMANMNQMFALQNSLQSCCCENRAGLADVKYAIATENCADRAALSDGVRDILAATQAQTQTIIDKLCQQEIDALKTQNANLQTQVNLANLQASQTAQTARILADNAAQTTALEQYLNPAPIPAYVVQNPNCCTNMCGCG